MKRNPHFIITGHMVRDMCAKSAQNRFLHRLHSVALVFHGLSASEVAQIFDDSPRAVAYWVKRFKQNGLTGLHEDARPGRPSRLNANQTRKLQRFVVECSETNKAVNADTVASFLMKEFKISLTPRQCWRILKRVKVRE